MTLTSEFVAHQRTAGRASWVGTIVLGPLQVPAKAYPLIAVRSSELHQVHCGCGGRVEYRKCCPKHGELRPDQIAKGYAYSAQVTIELAVDELALFDDPQDGLLRIQHLLRVNSMDLTLLSGRTLGFTPAHEAADSHFAAAVQILSRADGWGIGTIVLGAQRQSIALRASDDRLHGYVLHDAASRQSPPHRQYSSRLLTDGQLKRLEEQVRSLWQGFSWEQYGDQRQGHLQALIAKKVSSTLARGPRVVGKKSSPRRASKSTADGSQKRAA